MAPDRLPPQPAASRITEFAGHPVVAGVRPGQSSLVALTAASLARGTGASAVYFAYVDPSRYTDEEFPDGTVRHLPVDPDLADDMWHEAESALQQEIGDTMRDQDVTWAFRYLAGRTDRALTHLARFVDAAAFVIGARSGRHRVRDFVNESVSVQLSHRQHRPVVVVPLTVVDWKARAPWE